MKFTKIRIDGKIPSSEVMEQIARDLEATVRAAGYEAYSEVTSKSSIKLSNNQSSFKVNIARHGYNTRHRMNGSKMRSHSPTWDQRVEYNNLLNKVLDDFGVSCNVRNSFFKIRKGTEHFTESDWHEQKPDFMYHNEARGFYIEKGDYKAPKTKLELVK